MAVADEELAPFLSGEQGTVGLDLAREVVDLRQLVQQLTAQCAEHANTAACHAATAEAAMADCACAKEKLVMVQGALANVTATLVEYLGK